MIDKEIVELFFQRNENAIKETEKKYFNYCRTIAIGILHNEEDVNEVLNDTWMGVWKSIPPNKPVELKTYIGKITRRCSINKWRNGNTQKRGGNKVIQALEELDECISSDKTIEDEIDNKELGIIINSFLDTLPDIEQKVFVCRYWYMDSIRDIAENFGFSESKVKSMLMRTRRKLAKRLDKEGILI